MRVVRGFEEVGKVDDPQLGHPVSEVAGREVAEGERSSLHLVEQVARPAAGVEDVVFDLHVHLGSYELPKQLGDPRQPTTVGGVRRTVATQADGQPGVGCGHERLRLLRFRYTDKYSGLQNTREAGTGGERCSV